MVLVASAALLRVGWADQSPTVDEFAHLGRGLALHTSGDSRLSYAHPPLANELAVALSGAADGFDPERITDSPHFGRRASIGGIKAHLLGADYADMRARLMVARVAMGAFLLLLVLYAYAFCRRRWGPVTAVCAAGLLAFNPTLLAHARLVTTDLAVACFALIAAGEVAELVLTRRKRHLVGACLGIAAVVLSKHSGLMFAVVLATVSAVGLAVAGPRRPWWRRVVPAAAVVALMAGTSILAVNAAYRFQGTGSTPAEILADPLYGKIIGKARELREGATPRGEDPEPLVLERLPSSLPLPLPRPYLAGLEMVVGHAGHHDGYQWFWGEPNRNGTWRYFPVLMLIKSPLGVLAGIFVALHLAVAAFGSRRWRRRWLRLACTSRRLPLIVFGGVGALFLGSAMGSSLNIGFRHVLPSVALLTVPAAWSLARLHRDRRRWVRAVPLLASASLLVECLWTAPFYLSYFNLAVGRHLGHRVSLLSEDWGQTRGHLVRYVREHGLGTIHYGSEMGVLRHELRYLGLDYEPFGCETRLDDGWVVINAETFERRRANKPSCHPWVEGREPDAIIAEHFYVYDLR